MKEINEDKINTATPQNGGIYIMRIAAVLLAIVSWWSTAQGLKQFVFFQEWQANLASLAIQGILLSLNFYLPSLFLSIKGRLAKFGFVFFTSLILSCSSIFSYIYIAGYAYREAWDMDSQLLVQSAYRENLYDARDYSEEYMKSLQATLSAQISDLYIMANDLESSSFQATDDLNLNADRSAFENEDFVASTEMTTAINYVEMALSQNATQSDKSNARTALDSLVKQITDEITDLRDRQIPAAQTAADREKNDRDILEDNLRNPPQGSDIDTLQQDYHDAENKYNVARESERNLQDDLAQYQTALQALQRYQNYLGFTSSNAGQQITTTLLDIQKGLFQSGTSISDPAELEQDAVAIFEQLLLSNEDFSGSTSEYQSMLTTMNGFIQNMSDYGEVASIRQDLENMISQLKTLNFNDVQDWQINWKNKLNDLKAKIGSLPVYIGGDSPELNQYSRTAAMTKLDNVLRNYISDHNDVEQAFIYLQSPYRALALFSLVVAYLLDIAAFIIGFIIYLEEKRTAQENSSVLASSV